MKSNENTGVLVFISVSQRVSTRTQVGVFRFRPSFYFFNLPNVNETFQMYFLLLFEKELRVLLQECLTSKLVRM